MDEGTGSTSTLAHALSQFARSVQRKDDPYATLTEIVAAATRLIPGCEHGSVTVVRGRHRLTSQAASSELPRVVDALQEQTGQGPCLDAIHEHETVRVPDMASEQRWPLFAERACRAGAGSMLSFQLYVTEDTLGALNLFAGKAGAFDEESEVVGTLFASHAAIALAASQELSALHRAVATRQLIGQAQGILMERHGLTGDQAFAALVQVSQDRNVKLRDVASELVYTGASLSRVG